MYTSIEAVFSRLALPHGEYDEGDVIEWIMQGLDMTNIRTAYEREMAVLSIENHKAKLPPGIVQIEIVAAPTYGSLATPEEVAEMTDCQIDYINKQHVDRIQEYGIINNYNLFIRSEFYRNNFYVLRLANRPLMGKFHCSTCPNLHSNCDVEYTLNTQGILTTSFESGDICVGYLKHATGEDGQFIIPDEENLIQGLAYFAMAKYWEVRYNMKDEGAERRYVSYLSKAQNMLAKARGIQISRNFNFKDYSDIVYKHIKWANSYTIFNKHKYSTWTRAK